MRSQRGPPTRGPPRRPTPGHIRGGIRKPGSTPPVQTDRDGDLDMSGGAYIRGGSAGRNSRSRGGSGRDSITPQPTPRRSTRHGPNNGLSIENIDRALRDARQQKIRGGGTGINGVSRGLSNRPHDQTHIRVRGWRESKAATNDDGGVKSLLDFLQKKASGTGPKIDILQSWTEGDSLIVEVPPETLERFLHLHNFTFAGSSLIVDLFEHRRATNSHKESPFSKGVKQGGSTRSTGTATDTKDVKSTMVNILKERYDPTSKLLNLSALGNDEIIRGMGVLGTNSTAQKFFPALMKIADSVWETPTKKREMVASVTIANNDLDDVSLMTTLAVTFPELKNLDLSNNHLKTMDALKLWRWKFRELEHICLANNDLILLPDTKETLLRWYPKLLLLDNQQIRDLAVVVAKQNPIPVLAASFQDQGEIAANFLTTFFPLFDDNREQAIQSFYDAGSNFSLSVNTSAPRVPSSEAISWDGFIKQSRNLSKVNHLTARMSRLHTGTEAIQQSWIVFGKTKHPSFVSEADKWLVECHPVPGLPDPTGDVAGGVGGLIVMTHGLMDEIDVSNGRVKQTRSFDRTFILGPGSGLGGIRVISDVLCLRAYGASEAWKVINLPLPQQNAHPQAPPGYGVPSPEKSEDQVKKETMVLEISFKTRMNLELSFQCLDLNDWDMEKGLANFANLQAENRIPPDMLLNF